MKCSVREEDGSYWKLCARPAGYDWQQTTICGRHMQKAHQGQLVIEQLSQGQVLRDSNPGQDAGTLWYTNKELAKRLKEG